MTAPVPTEEIARRQLAAPPERERVRAILPDRDRALLLARRQCLLIELGAIETYLGMERSVVPRHKRDDDDYKDGR